MPPLNRKPNAKVLPTWRMAPSKQLEVLRAYAAACGDAPRGVSNPEVASIVGLKADTVSLVNGFFTSMGLLTKGDSGCTPADEVLNYGRAFKWNQETAFHQTASKFAATWFGEALIPKLRFKPVSVDEAIGIMGQAGAVGPESKRELEMALWYLEQSGVIERENGTIRLGKTEVSDEKPDTKTQLASASIVETQVRTFAPSDNKNRTGAIRLNVEIDVDTEEIAKWTPDRITSFMSGLAQVLAAKGEAAKILP